MRASALYLGLVRDLDARERRAGTRVLGVRRHLDITQQQLADTVGMTRDAVSSIERGRRYFRLGEAAAICQALGVDLSALVAEAPLVLETRSEKQFE